MKTAPRTWYLPHFGVLSLNKPGKFRFVFVATERGIGGNDFLLSGADLLTPPYLEV